MVTVRRYGADAMLEVGTRANHRLDGGDIYGAEKWHRILDAIERLQAVKPVEGRCSEHLSAVAATFRQPPRSLRRSNIASVTVEPLHEVFDRIANAIQNLGDRLHARPARFSSPAEAFASVEGSRIEGRCLCKAGSAKAMRLGRAVDRAPYLGVGESSHGVSNAFGRPN